MESFLLRMSRGGYLQVHTGWRMERFDKHQDTDEVRDSVQGPTSVSKNHKQSPYTIEP